VLASAHKETARNVIQKFNANGLDVLKAGPHRPYNISATFAAEKIEQLFSSNQFCRI
jgi:hypothetical protein